MQICDIRSRLAAMGFIREKKNHQDIYRTRQCEIRLSPQVMQVIGSGASVYIDIDDVRLMRLEERMLRIVVRGGHHSFLL